MDIMWKWNNMKKTIIMICIGFTSCAYDQPKRMCEHAGWIVIGKTEFKPADVYYQLQEKDEMGEIITVTSQQIDWNFNIGDTIKPCKVK